MAKLSASSNLPSLLPSFYRDAPDSQSAGITSCLLHLLALFPPSQCLQVKGCFGCGFICFGTSALKRNHSQRKLIVFISRNCLMPWYLQPATRMENAPALSWMLRWWLCNNQNIVRLNIKSLALMTQSSAYLRAAPPAADWLFLSAATSEIFPLNIINESSFGPVPGSVLCEQ